MRRLTCSISILKRDMLRFHALWSVVSSLWARGYSVSTVGANEHAVREYIRHQEDSDRRDDQQLLLGLQDR